MYNIYIDEAGDEGFKFNTEKGGKGSSQWFILSALIVKDSDDLLLASTVNEIKSLLKFKQQQHPKPLHFVEMPHDKRKAALNCLAKKDSFKIITIAIDKKAINFNSALIREKQALYNYSCKLLLERICVYLKEKSLKGNLIFENRSNTRYEHLNSYLQNVSINNTKKGFINSFKALNKGQSKNLQLVDMVASSFYQALEPNIYDEDIEASYVLKLQKHLYSHKNKVFGSGLKLFPPDVEDLIIQEKYSWLKNIFEKG